MLARTLVVAVLGILCAASSAVAAAPITLSTDGFTPQVAVDSQGNAHIVYNVSSAGGTSVQYCEIPAGATTCSVSLTFPSEGGTDPRIVLGSAAGEVVIIDPTGVGQAGADVSLGIDVWVSMDGGKTFNAGTIGGGYQHVGGDGDPFFFLGSQAGFGPGGFSVSMLDDGGYYQDIPINSGPPVGSGMSPTNTEDTKLFTDGCGGYGPTSVAMVNATTPIAVCEAGTPGDPTALEYRIATGQGDIDDVTTGSWGAVQQLPIGNNSSQQPSVVGGLRGVYALYDAAGQKLTVSHLSDAAFGSATRVTPAATAPYDFSQDATGNLYALYGDNFGGGGSPLALSTSQDGVSWTSVPLDLAGVDGPPPVAQVSGCAAAGPGTTGNGWVVWGVGGTPAAKIEAEHFGDSPCGANQGSKSCPTQLTVGAAQLIATSSCFAAAGNGTYKTGGQVELNGMMIDPGGATAASVGSGRIATAGQLVVDTVNKTVSDTAPALVQVANVGLTKHSLDWLIPAHSGTITNLASTSRYAQPVSFDPSSLKSKMLGFAINGLVTPSLEPGGQASLPVNVQMPSPIGGFIGPPPTDDLNLTSGDGIPGGLSLSPGSVHIDIPDVSLGIAELKPFKLDYDSDPEVFDGEIGLVLPVVDNSIDTQFRFEQGQFVYGKASLDFGMDFPIYTDVFLQKVDLHVAGKRGNACANPATESDGPTSIGGGVTVAVGPVVDGTAALAVDGDATYTFPEQSCTPAQPGVFAITGAGSLFGYNVANANATFSTDGNIGLGASLGIGTHTFGLFADVQGAVEAHSPFAFYATGDAKVYLGGIGFGPTITVSSIGVGGCLSPLGYIEYKWGHGLSGGLLGCDLDDLIPQGLSSSARVAGAATTITVPRHESAEEIELRSGSGAPLVALSGPGGARVTTPAPAAGVPGALTQTPAADVVVDPSTNTTAIKLIDPAAGRWTIQTLPGSPAITGLSIAKALPPISVKAHVLAGRGTARSLAYRSTPAHGRVVTFLERGAGNVLRAIGRTKSAGGRIRFVPAPGPGGRRTILAQVTERGLGDGRAIKVASYIAPGPPRLVAPRNVKVTRHGSRISISWGGVPGASRYAVRAVLKDGRALLSLVPRSRHSVTVAAVPGLDAGKMMVAALNASNRPGPIGTVGLKAVKPTCRSPRAVKGKLVCATTKRKPSKKPKKPKHG